MKSKSVKESTIRKSRKTTEKVSPRALSLQLASGYIDDRVTDLADFIERDAGSFERLVRAIDPTINDSVGAELESAVMATLTPSATQAFREFDEYRVRESIAEQEAAFALGLAIGRQISPKRGTP
jgi:hypothetical protein